MASSSNVIDPPSRAKFFGMALANAKLIRALYGHPDYHMITSSATFVRPDYSRTPNALCMFTEFVENTYINYVLPLLPPGVSRKCKDVSNPWAYADPNYQWEWTWDAQAEEFVDKSGNKVGTWPELSAKKARENHHEIWTRVFVINKLALENSTDPRLHLMVGGSQFDFGDEVKEEARNFVVASGLDVTGE